MSWSCGVCIYMGPCWIACTCDFGTIVCGRAIWVSLQIDDALLGFLSVYAPTDPLARVVMWIEIVEALPVVDSWIVEGDFNNIESALRMYALLLLCISRLSPRESMMLGIDLSLRFLGWMLGMSLLLCICLYHWTCLRTFAVRVAGFWSGWTYFM